MAIEPFVQVKLSKGKYALVDTKDYPLVQNIKWHAKYSKGNWYAATRPKGFDNFMHNLIFGKVEGMEVDHKNQNGLDNRRANLRLSTPSQNRANVARRLDNKSGYKGVCYHRPSDRWRAYIQKEKKWKHLGYFNTKQDAAIAYNSAAQELFGDFAWLNPIH